MGKVEFFVGTQFLLGMFNPMPNPKMIKTGCGIDKYHQLKRDRSFWGKLRLKWFVAIATLRDFNK